MRCSQLLLILLFSKHTCKLSHETSLAFDEIQTPSSPTRNKRRKSRMKEKKGKGKKRRNIKKALFKLRAIKFIPGARKTETPQRHNFFC
jgi:hypothetical protein